MEQSPEIHGPGQKTATESLCCRSALQGYSYSSYSDKMEVRLLPLYVGGHWKLSTRVKEWADSIPTPTIFHCQQTYLISSSCVFLFIFLNLWYIFIKKKPKKNQAKKPPKTQPKTNSYFLFIVFVEPLDSICTNALAKSLQMFWQALLAGDRHTGFAIERMIAWLLLILGPGKW